MVAESGMRSIDHRLEASTSREALLALVAALNRDPEVHGILVQLPLPPQIYPTEVIAAIDPTKDVDGFHPLNVGRIALGLPALAPCTPLGCILLATTVHASLLGLEALVIGRSNIVGKPLAQLLTDRDRGAFQDPRSAGGVPAGGPRVRRDRPLRIRAGRLDQAGCDRDRRRRQPGHA